MTEPSMKDTIDAAFAVAADANPESFTSSEDVAARESVEKDDTSPPKTLDQGPDTAQDKGTVEPPSGAGPKELAKALDDIRRSGLKDVDLNGKSEEYILEFGRECDTLKRQRDRERTERQNQEREAGGQSPSEAASSEPKATDDDDATVKEDPPADPEVDFTPLVEEFGEEAARPVIDALAAMKRENADLKAKFEGQEQERQLAPILKRANETMDGMAQTRPDLSKPESRDALLADVDKLSVQFKDKYDALPEEERMAAVFEDAAQLRFGAAEESNETPAQEKRIASPPSSDSTDVPDSPPRNRLDSFNRGFDKAWDKHKGRGRS